MRVRDYPTDRLTFESRAKGKAIRREGVWWRGVEEAALVYYLGRGYPLVCQLEPTQQKWRNTGRNNRQLSSVTKTLHSTGPGGSYFLKFGQVCSTKGLKNDTLFETKTRKLTPNWTEKQKLTMTWDGVVSVTSEGYKYIDQFKQIFVFFV